MAGRPSKLSKDLIRILGEVVDTKQSYVLMTDEDLVDELNDRLLEAGLEKNMIDQRTFERYKHKHITNSKVDKNKDDKNPDLADEFCRLYKKNLRFVKNEILSRLRDGTKLNSNGWLMERRFKEWNIRNKHDVNHNAPVVVGWNFTEAKAN